MSNVARATSGAGRVVGYAGNLILLAGATLISIPVLIAAAGTGGWEVIAVGQAIGLILQAPWAYGWGFIGVSRIARMRGDSNEIWAEIKTSMVVRTVLAPLIFVISAIASLLTVPEDVPLMMAAVFSTAALGLRMNWVFVGLQSPVRLFAAETLPRVVCIVAGILVLLVEPRLVAFALVLQALGPVLSFVATGVWARVRATVTRRVHPYRALLENRGGVFPLTVSALWGSVPTLAVSWLAPSDLAQLALVLRVQAQANTATSPIVDALQGWVPASAQKITRRRALRALVVSSGLGLVGAIALIAVANPVYSFLGAGLVVPTIGQVAISALVVALTFSSQTAIRAGLAPLGLTKVFSFVVYAGMSAGLLAMVLLVPVAGAQGALGAVAICLIVQIIISLISIIRVKTT